MNLSMRASDADRERVVAQLQQHTAAGRLTLDELSDRGRARLPPPDDRLRGRDAC